MSAIHFESSYDDSKLESGLNRSNQKISDWARKAARSGEPVQNMFRNVRNEGGQLDNFFKGMGNTVNDLLKPLSALALAYKFKQLAQDAYDFEREFGMAMREVQTISQSVKDDFEGISDQLVQMAANGPDSAIKLAKAFYQIVSAGYDGAEGLKLLDISSKAATAGITDTKIAADGLTTVLNAWGISADNAENVADVMFKTVERGKTTFGELASSIAQVAPLASANNIEFEQIFAALQSITKQGTPTAQAMTQIRSSIVNMNNVLGDGWADTMTYQEGLARVAEMAGGSQTRLKQLIPDVEGVNAVLALTGEKASGAAEDLNATADSAGSMQTAFDTMMQEADNKWDVIYNKWTRNVRELGKAMKEESGTIARYADALLTNSEDLANSQFTVMGMADRVKAMQASSGGGFWNGVKSWLIAPFVSDSMVQQGFADFQKKIKEYASQGLDTQKLALDDILKIEDKDSRLEALNKFMEDLKKSESDLGDTQMQNEEHQQAALALRAKLWGDVEAKAKKAIEAAQGKNSGGGGSDETTIRTFKNMLDDLKDAKDQLGTGTIEDDVASYKKIAAVQKEIVEYTAALRKLQNGETPAELKGLKFPLSTKKLDTSTLAGSSSSALDWTKVFGDLDKVSTDALSDLRDKLKKYLSQIDNDIKPSDFAEITKALDSINDVIDERSPMASFSDAFGDLSEQNDKIAALKDQLKYYKEQGASAEVILSIEKQIAAAENERATSLARMTTAANKIGRLGQQAVSAGNDVIGMLSDLGVEVSDDTKKGIEGVGMMADALAEVDFTKPMSVVTAAIKATAAQVKLYTAIFGKTPDYISDEVFDRYEKLIDTIGEVIDKQKELLDSLSGTAATAQYEAAVDLINKQIEATENLGKDYLNSGAGTFSHSYGYNLAQDLKKYKDDFNAIGIDFDSLGGRMTGLFDLTADQLELIKEQIPEVWATLDDKTQEYLQTIIDSNDELSDLSDSLQESITGISFDSVKDSLDDLIQDVDTTWADVADSFEDHMRSAVLNFVKTSYLTDALQQWYNQFSEAYSDNSLSDSEVQNLQSLYNQIYQTGSDMYQAALDASGVSASSSSYTGLTGSIQRDLTEETGTELAGLMRKQSDDTRSIRDYTKEGIDHLINIEANTAQTVTELQSLNTKMDQVVTNTQQSSSSRDLGV